MKLPTFFLSKKNDRLLRTESRGGFILLFAVLSIGFLLAITLNLADSLYKQHKFLSFSSESLTALNNSNAGLECAMYWDRKQGAFDDTPITRITCGGQSIEVTPSSGPTFSFNLPNLNDNGYTAVTIDKSTATTTIEASGFSVNDATSEKRVMRSLAVSYGPGTAVAQCRDFDLMLALDISTSINATERQQLRDAAHQIVNSLDISIAKGHVGIVTFASNGLLRQTLTPTPATLHTVIDSSALDNPGTGGTNAADGLIESFNELNSIRNRPPTPDFILMITDGEFYGCADTDGNSFTCPGGAIQAEQNAMNFANMAKADGMKVIVIGIGFSGKITYGSYGGDRILYEDFLKDYIASDEQFFPVADYDGLAEAAGIINCAYFSTSLGKPNFIEK